MNKIIYSDDNSHTLFSEKFNEHYHSTFGAINESNHIFIEAGLKHIAKTDDINIFEMGFGTGLNALLTYKFAIDNKVKINYTTIEAYPIEIEVVEKLNYAELCNFDEDIFIKMHKAEEVKLSEFFTFRKIIGKLEDFKVEKSVSDLVFFDAFSPDTQPELWTEDVFAKIFSMLKNGGILTTYSCKGVVKRAMRSAGFDIKKLPGPPGKREFLRATKTI